MKYIKIISIIVGFWFIGLLASMAIVFPMDLPSELSSGIVRDLSISIMFLLIAIYFKKPYYLVLALIMFYFGFSQYYNSQIATESYVSKKDKVVKMVKSIAAKTNLETPQQVDAITVLEKVDAVETNLVYHYTSSKIKQEDMPTLNSDGKFIDVMKKGICETGNFDVFLSQDASVTFIYNDNNGDHLFTVNLDKEDCFSQ